MSDGFRLVSSDKTSFLVGKLTCFHFLSLEESNTVRGLYTLQSVHDRRNTRKTSIKYGINGPSKYKYVVV